jgi:hypothetical protein
VTWCRSVHGNDARELRDDAAAMTALVNGLIRLADVQVVR